MRVQRKWLAAGGLALALAMAMPAVAAAAARTTGVARRDGAAGPGRRRPRPAAALPAALPRLSAQQLAGQRVIYSYPGLTPPASLISLIQHGEAAGVIFFGQNISSEAQIAAVIRQLNRANASSLNPVRAPLLLMTDQEGGQVRRLPGRPYCPRSRSARIRWRRRRSGHASGPGRRGQPARRGHERQPCASAGRVPAGRELR